MSEGGDNSIISLSERLRQAASQGQFDLVRELVKTGAKFSTDQEGRTALHYAALNGHVDICKFLLQQGCNIDDRDVLGYTPLHRAASKGHVEAIELLLTSKCNVDSQDEHGNGAIHEASWNGFSQTLEVLIKYHCNIILTNKSGFTALHLASQNGHNQSARVLLYAGCNADLKNNYGDTALHTAARYGHAGVTRILISARCRLNEQNKNGDTALHISSALKRKKIAKLLVEAGIDINIINKQDETAIDVARRKDHPEVIMTITSLLKTKAQIHPSPKIVNFSEIPVDIDGPVVVPDEDAPLKTDKSEKGSKFFSFLKKKKKDKDKPAPVGSQVHPTASRPAVQGFFSQYIPKTGQQYYRDLAGNIKQGPVGYTPICQCMPALEQLEKRVDKDKEHIYEHIDASHQILKNRMDQLDRRTTQQITSFDQWSRERFDEEERNCYSRIDQRLGDQQHYMSHKNRGGMDVDDWLETKLSEYGHCLDHHHDDSALPNNNIFTDIHQTENGRLFRSRSDETLSQSDNHSGKFRKRQFYESRQQAMQKIRAWQLPSYGKERNYHNPNPVSGRRDNYNVQNPPQTFNRNTNQQSVRQNFVSPVSSQQNTRSSSRPDFISPTTGSTNRSPQSFLAHDPVYGGQSMGYDQGAIPKRLPNSQTWHGANELPSSVHRATSAQNHKSTNELRTSGYRELNYGGKEMRGSIYRESSPLVHSTPKSRDSSPYDYEHLPRQRQVKTKTEQENSIVRQSERNIQSEIKNNKIESRNIYNDSRHINHQPRTVESENTESFERQNEVRRSHMESRNLQTEKRNSETRRSFPERGSSNTSTGTNMTSNSSSTGQGPLNESSTGKVAKPTFTTFGYSEEQKVQNTQTVEKPVVQNPSAVAPNKSAQVKPSGYSFHQSESTYGYHNRIGAKLQTESSSRLNTYPEVKEFHNEGVGYSVSRTPTCDPKTVINAGDSARNSLNTENRDDMYILANQNLQMTRQRSRSSDGILLEEEELTSAHQMKLKINDFSAVQRSATPNSPRSGQGQSYNVQLETVKKSLPLYGSGRSYAKETIEGNSRIYPSEKRERNLQNSNYNSASQRNVYPSSGQMYSSSRDAPYNGERGNQIRDRPYWANDRENPYGSVQNFSNTKNEPRNQVPLRQSNAYSTYNLDINNHGKYSDNTNVSKTNSKSEPHLDHPTSIQDQSLSPRDSNRNLQSTPIQDKSKEDNSSNPDSGYSSKIFGRNVNSAHGASTSNTPSSSFSNEPTDHNITLSSNNSPHPQVNHTDYAQIDTVKQQYQKDLSNHVQQWYQRKLKDAAKNLNDGQYGQHGDYYSQSSNNVTNTDDYSNYEYVQPSRQMPYHGNQLYSSYQQVPNYIRGSDV